jgi:acyl-CoA thioesterase-1
MNATDGEAASMTGIASSIWGSSPAGRRGRVIVLATAFMALVVGCERGDAELDTGARPETTYGAQDTSPLPEPQSGTGAAANASGIPAAERQVILFVGTSLTAGYGLHTDSAYPQLIQRKIDSAGLPFRVVNAGVSGETTAGLLERLDWLLETPFDVVVVETGANDGLRGVPASNVRSNLQRIVRRIRSARPASEIILIQMEALPNYGATYVSAFRGNYADVAREEGVVLIPFLLDGVAGKAQLNQSDGIHPNMEGERVVAENVWRSVRPHLGRRAGVGGGG